jgi:SAM-dependent methyltransferase
LNYFENRDSAEQYAGGRPYFHPLVVRKIEDFLDLPMPVPLALDVACGTGQSIAALKQIAERIVGTDSSEEMLARAPQDARIRYVKAPAEKLPFAEGSFNLITAALAFHWFDRAPFLAEAQRVLDPSGWLIVYDNWFTGRVAENPKYEGWYGEEYLARYPSPPRNKEPLTDAGAIEHGFELVGRERCENEVSFSPEEMVGYLMTQSNVIVAVEKEEGAEGGETVYEWLMDAQAPFFGALRGTFLFEGSIDYLRPTAV